MKIREFRSVSEADASTRPQDGAWRWSRIGSRGPRPQPRPSIMDDPEHPWHHAAASGSASGLSRSERNQGDLIRLKPLAAALLAVPAALLAQAGGHQPRHLPFGLELNDMDRSVRPGDDFFAYAEGTWLRDHPIPADKTGAGYNYELPDEIEGEVRTIVEQAEAHPATADDHKVGDYYAAWMDADGVEARSLAPLRPYLACIAAARTLGELEALSVEPGHAGPIRIGISADPDDPTRYEVEASQRRLGLPVRDYYLLDGSKYVAIRRAYRDYLARMATLAGMPEPEAKADAALALETRISRDQWTPEQLRDPVKTHNPMTRTQLRALAPGLDWDAMLAGLEVGGVERVDVGATSAVAAAGRAFADTPLQAWKDYLALRFVSDHAQFLPRAFDEANFAFYGRTLRDQPEQRARWKRGVALLDGTLGEAVGQIYVRRYWTPDTQARAEELLGDMRAAYRDRIEHAAWMDEATRRAALAKLATFDPRIGRPAKWIDYSSLAVSRTDPLGNDVAADGFRWRLEVRRLPHPVDRGLWGMTPQTVNAYYDPTLNQITVPAAILQPPFFDAYADPAVNYAETGATTIGHEMGHGYDDEGRQFDAQGRLKDWWSADTALKYKVKAERLAGQFDAYEPIPGVHIKGHLTLGENLADLGGLETAYLAYRRYVSRHGKPPVIGGLTGDQRFFIAFAQAWQGKVRDGAARAQLLSDPHSPDKYRVDGIVRNFDPWYAAFGIKAGDRLYLPPDQRVHIWTE